MKSVLISIQPKRCELIARGQKTVEVRKTAPKLQMPFKCYIYDTKGTFDITLCPDLNARSVKVADKGRGKIISEFVCDKVDVNYPILVPNTDIALYNDEWVLGAKTADACLTLKEIAEYGKGKPVYGWHISDLKIYDKPKELGELCKPRGTIIRAFDSQFITRPPQSWFYVEELKGEKDEI